MPTLGFTLGPEGVVRIHDAVLCLAKFSDTVGLEASSDRVGCSLWSRVSPTAQNYADTARS